MRAGRGRRGRSGAAARRASPSGAAQQRPELRGDGRFIDRHEDAIAYLFAEVLSLCAKQGRAASGVIAADVTKLPGNASRNANVDDAQIGRGDAPRSPGR